MQHPLIALLYTYLLVGLIHGLQIGLAGLPCLYRACDGRPDALETTAYWVTILGNCLLRWPTL